MQEKSVVSVIRYVLCRGNMALPDVDQELFYHTCVQHRIVGKALEKIEQENNSGLDGIELRLRREHAEIMYALFSRIRTICSVVEKIQMQTKVCFLKGNTNFLLSNNLYNIKESKDCDIIVEDESKYRSASINLEKNNLKSLDNLDIHEIDSFVVDNTAVDVHRCFPVIARQSKTNTGVSYFDPEDAQELSFSYLSRASKRSDIGRIPICGPTEAAVAGIAHCYRDYVKFSSMTSRSKPPIRAGDIWDIYCFFSMAEFCIDDFFSCIKKYNMYEQLYIVSDLIADVIGDSSMRNMTRSIIGNNIYTYDDNKKYRIVFNEYWQQMASHAFLHTQHINAIKSISANAKKIYIGEEQQLVDESHQFLPEKNDGRGLEFSGTIRFDKYEVDITIKPEWRGLFEGRRVHIDINGIILEWNKIENKLPYFSNDGIYCEDVVLHWNVTDFDAHHIKINRTKITAFTEDTLEKVSILFGVGEFGKHPKQINIGSVLPIVFEVLSN